jgi:hypothetical protein
MVVRRLPKSNKLEYKAWELPDKKITVIAPADYGDDDYIATAQTGTGAPWNMTLTSSPVTLSTARKISIRSTDDDSGNTFTVTYKDENGVSQTSDAVTGPNDDYVVVTKSGTEILATEVSQISVSGNSVGNLSAGVFIDYSNASDSEKEYGFISEDDGFMNNTEDGYKIW